VNVNVMCEYQARSKKQKPGQTHIHILYVGYIENPDSLKIRTDSRTDGRVNRGKPKVTNGFSNKLAGGNCKQRQTEKEQHICIYIERDRDRERGGEREG